MILEWNEYEEDGETHGEIWEKEGFMSDFPSDLVDLAEHLFDCRYWHSTDGWRGYYDTKPNEERLSRLEMGFNWLSGHHSQHKEQKKMQLFTDAITELQLPVFLVTNQTGNFSSYTDVFVRTEDLETFLMLSTFINKLVGDSDPRWDVGVLIHFDSDAVVGQSAVEDLNKRQLPKWWSWKTFVDKYYILKDEQLGMKTASIEDLDDEQQLGVFAQGMFSSDPLRANISKMLVEMKKQQIINKDQK